jgi:superfamily II DNA or RNA helicase
MKFAVGSLVKARKREWVVLPESDDTMLMLRPLGGRDDEIAGIYLPLEKVEPATFALPDPSRLGDYRSCKLLRDAVRLGFRSSAGAFRSFGRIAVEPRPYQIVPLLMALKLDPVRILIADDVGVGKTVEACLIARELLDRGEIQRMSVLCPPQLAEQWQKELRNKFHIDAELVLASTASSLERGCFQGQSLFEKHPFTVVSMDFIKSERRHHEFQRACPELVIVDEAHACATGGDRNKGRHQRYQLISTLAEDPGRHMIFVTATPHSGNEQAFRSLISLLDQKLKDLPDDLSGPQNEAHRRRLAQHFVQRRRENIRSYMNSETLFPTREESNEPYNLSPEYKRVFEKVLDYARDIVRDVDGKTHHQRVRWWSALALLRALASSPAAAVATLKSRASTLDTETIEEADEIGKRLVLDLVDDEGAEIIDTTAGSDLGEENEEARSNRKKLLELAREAELLKGDKDLKLQKLVAALKKLLKDKCRPIVFCRFINTADYLAEALKDALPRTTEVASITGSLPPAEREERILQLAEAKSHVLVATDCLSEGINLQDHFDAVIHYDLSWNPTRHEQREGRVDRFGQSSDVVHITTVYGVDNQIDGIVLEILIKKHKAIKNSLGISVPVPINSDQVIEAIFEGLLLREKSGKTDQFEIFEEYIKPQKEAFYGEWDRATKRESIRSMFAQAPIKVEQVQSELDEVRRSLGSSAVVKEFTLDALGRYGAVITKSKAIQIDLNETSQSLKDMLVNSKDPIIKARFEMPVKDDEIYLTRTHQIVESLSSHVLDTALDDHEDAIARRCGVIRTSEVQVRTTVLLLRLRFHIIKTVNGIDHPLLAEESSVIGFTGSAQHPQWLDDADVERLLDVKPDGNIDPDQARHFVEKVIEGFGGLEARLENVAMARGDELLESHKRVRAASRIRGVTYRVEPKLPVDILGVYTYLPI